MCIYLLLYSRYIVYIAGVEKMPIQYKIDIIEELKNKGYTTYILRKNKLLGEATIQRIRQQLLISYENINTICELLQCQPGDILEHIPEQPETCKQ